jgi:hypothetical protein
MDTIKVNFTDGEQNVALTVEERVFPDRSCGQYEAGWAVFNEADEVPYFVSQEGVLYAWGTGTVLGTAPEVAAETERMERELDRLYAQGGM